MIFTNPTVNSYKRLAAERSTVFQPEFPAAVWEKGSEKAVHVKEDRNGRISVEVQFPDPSANPYLALTAILAAGLEAKNPSDAIRRCFKTGVSRSFKASSASDALCACAAAPCPFRDAPYPASSTA